MATPEMLAAVKAAVTGEPAPASAPVDPPADTPAAPEPAEPAAAAPAPKEDLIGTPPAGSAEPAAAEPARGPDGKFVAAAAPKAGEPAAVAPAAAPAVAAAPVAPAVPAAPPKVPDPINDPIPANAKPETRERITTLVEAVKTRDTELAATRGDLELIMGPIDAAGATPEQFRESMQLLKNINSPHQHEQMQALEYLQGAAALLAERLGQVPAGVDPLSGHDDLIGRVNANTLSRKDAEEIAQLRRSQAATRQFQQQTQQRSQQAQEQTRAVQAGQAAVRDVEESFKAIDPHYERKVALLRADATFMGQLRAMPPTQWAAAFAQKYRSVQVAAAPAPAAAPAAAAAPGAPTPLRAKSPAGGTAKAPSTQLEAVTAAISRVRTG